MLLSRAVVIVVFAPIPPSALVPVLVSICTSFHWGSQCDGAWWVPLSGLSWLPSKITCGPLLGHQAPSPHPSIVDGCNHLFKSTVFICCNYITYNVAVLVLIVTFIFMLTCSLIIRKQPTFFWHHLVSPQNDDWERSAEIPYWWCVTTQIWVVGLISWSIFHATHNQSGALPTSG